MAGRYGATLGVIGFAAVMFQATFSGDLVHEAVSRGLISLVVFLFMGWMIGRAADYLVCQSVEQQFRKRVDWYRNQLSDAEHPSADHD